MNVRKMLAQTPPVATDRPQRRQWVAPLLALAALAFLDLLFFALLPAGLRHAAADLRTLGWITTRAILQLLPAGVWGGSLVALGLLTVILRRVWRA